ncbi:ArsR family transcriptional regulator [Candidatus Woesearchaeota archaeon]|nr:MAG: ArsR family transcriptional regulator [Candidatus Woesearchaeota archaeon]
MEPYQIFKALGEETRYLIVKELVKKSRCACELPVLIKRTQPNTSMHLSKLSAAGIVKSERRGKEVLYSLADDRVIKLIELAEEICK